MQNSPEGNCACKTQAVKPDLVKVKEGTSGSFKPNSSLSPCFIEQTPAQSQSVPYRRVSTRSQTDSCTEMRSWLDTKSADDIKFEQNRDTKISTVITWKNEASERPVWERVSHLDTDYKSYWTQWNRLAIKNGIFTVIREGSLNPRSFKQYASGLTSIKRATLDLILLVTDKLRGLTVR